MVSRLISFLNKLLGSRNQPVPQLNVIGKDDTSRLKSGINTVIKNCNINLVNSEIILDDDVCLDGYNISMTNSSLKIGKHSFLINNNPYFKNSVSINEGRMEIGKNSRVVAKEISIRWGGVLTIADYTAINEGCEIRCDQSITIGSFVMMSYECMVYDTNTHMVYAPEKRRQLTMSDYPYIGTEHEKPHTKPVIIGDDCWIGKRSTILKGVTLGNFVIVGTGSVVTTSIAERMICAGNPAKVVKPVTVS